MMSHPLTDSDRSAIASDLRAQASTRAAFFIAGLAMAAWAPLVPFAKGRLGIDEGTLGLLLFCLGGGSMLAMPFSGVLTGRYGCRAVILGSTLATCLALPGLALGGNVPTQAVALLIFGAGVGTLDAAMNVQAVIVEKAAAPRAMMSGFHGLFSVGGIAGAGGVGGLLWLGATPLAATLAVAGLVVLLTAAFGRHWLPYGTEGGSEHFVWPRGVVLLIGGLCFLVFLAEGSMLDWSAVFLTTVRGTSPVRAGLGYAAFATAMTAGRLCGDRVTQALGGRTILVGGSVCAMTGFVLAVAVPSEGAALVGFGLIGLGASNCVPVLFSAVGRQTAMPTHLAIPAATMIGYAGILSGPALIGFAAQTWSLPVAFLGVAASLLAVAGCAGRVTGAGGSAL